MYKREILKSPKKITRRNFVKTIFDVGYLNGSGYDTMMIAVQVGDFFINYKDRRIAYKGWKKKMRNSSNDPEGIADKKCRRIYSKELAHTVIVIAEEFNEDHAYNIYEANMTCNNSYVYKLEWEICLLLKFNINPSNYIRLMDNLIGEINYIEYDKYLSTVFWDLSRRICLSRKMSSINPITLLLGIIILHKKGKLKSIRDNRRRKFLMLIIRIGHEYEVSLIDILQAYIKYKK